MREPPEISFVVPVFNEQENLASLLGELVAAMDRTGRSWEAVFVDDGSTDGSLGVIRRLAGQEPRLRYVAFAENRGQSAAFCAGFDAARAPIVVTMDADLQNDPADVPHLLHVFDEGHDMVIGFRAKRKDTLSKRLASKIGNAIRRRFTGDTVRDTGCSLKVMRRELLLELPRFKNMHRYLPALMQARGADVAEASVNHRPRAHGQSKYGTWDRAVAGAWDLIGVRWLLARTLRWQVRERSE